MEGFDYRNRKVKRDDVVHGIFASGDNEYESIKKKQRKGIGMILLEKMGYEGGGLGKNAQGIVTPIEAKLRPKNSGLGFNEYKEEANFVIKLSEDLPEKDNLWPKQSYSKNKKKKDYVTAEELTKQEKIEKVIDMRGPEVRVLTNLENLNAEYNSWENDFLMSKLQHNIDLSEFDVQKAEHDLRNERKKLVTFQKEKQNLENDVTKEIILEKLVKLVVNESPKLTLDSLAKSLEDLLTQFPLLNNGSMLLFDSHYTRLFMEVVFPAIRISITNTWQARDPEPLLLFLESWKQLLPDSALETILDNIVMPKLSAAVDSWDPRQETTPLHYWVHPWLPLLGQKLEYLYPTIRNQLQSFLRSWHPSDTSVYNMLSPWKTVFDPKSWERIMVQCIIPKLLVVMHEFEVVYPLKDQKVDEFYWV